MHPTTIATGLRDLLWRSAGSHRTFVARPFGSVGYGADFERAETVEVVVPTTPLRIHGADPVDTVPSPKLGQHNREIYGDWLGLSAADIAALEQDGVI
jgi:hypothetical protein